MPGLEDRRRVSNPAPLSSSSASTADSSPPSPAPSPFVRHDELEVIFQERSMEMTRLFGDIHQRLTRLEAGQHGTNERVDDGFKGVDKGLKDLQKAVTEALKGVNKRYKNLENGVDEVFKAVDTGFKGVDKGFKHMETGIDQASKSMETGLDKRVNRVDGNLDELRKEMKNMRNTQLNGRAFRPHHQIRPVSPPNKTTRLGPTPPLPTTVMKLWSLKDPAGHDRLALYIEAYDIDDWPYWRNNAFGEVDSYEHGFIYDDQSEHLAPYTNVRDAVANHPAIAIQSLATEIGLDYEKINGIMERDAARQRSPMGVVKRQAPPLQQDTLERASRRRTNFYQNQSLLAATQPVSHHTPSSPDEVVGWDANALPADRSFKRFQDVYPHDQPRPDAPSPATPSFYVPIRPAETSPSALSPTIPDDDRIDPSTIPDNE